MAKMDVSVSVEKSPYELMAHMAKLVAAVKSSGGFHVSAIPADVAALVAELPGIVADCGQIESDIDEDKLAFSKGSFLGVYLIAEAVLAK